MCTLIISTLTIVLGLAGILGLPLLLLVRFLFKPTPWRAVTGKARATTPGLGWSEQYLDGSKEAEGKYLVQAATDINSIQVANKRKSKSRKIARGFHAKIHAGIVNAEFRIGATVPEQLQVGFFQPNKTYRAIVRFSNAAGIVQSDKAKDLRGIAVRVIDDAGVAHDFLATSAPVSHVRDARQFMGFGKAMAGSKLLLLPRLFWYFGLRETVRMLKTAAGQVKRQPDSLATEQYWSRAAYAFGETALQFSFAPTAEGLAVPAIEKDKRSDNFLREDLVQRLARGPVTLDFNVQLWMGDEQTPIEDGIVEWKESDSQPITVAQLVIPQQDLTSTEAAEALVRVDGLEFNPWVTSNEFRPLGSMNRARHPVYRSSAALRNGRVGEPARCPLRR